jgi:phage N-6-adenine-methyltransferase
MADDWYTPKWIFDTLAVDFDLDVCSPEGGTGLVPAKKFYTIEDDALVQPWDGFVWMNPPYSNPTPFMNKFIEHGNGISLVPVSKAKWFGRVWEDADSLCIVPPNLKFERPNGKSGQIMFQCILVGMGDMARSTLTKSKIGKIR